MYKFEPFYEGEENDSASHDPSIDSEEFVQIPQ